MIGRKSMQTPLDLGLPGLDNLDNLPDALPRAQAGLSIDPVTRRLWSGGVECRVSQRAIELLSALVDLVPRGSSSLSAEAIGELPSWQPKRARSRASLGMEIRREIRALQRAGIDAIACPHRCLTTGPYWLKGRPPHPRSKQTDKSPRASQTALALIRWLDITEPVWLSAHTADKPGQQVTRVCDPTQISAAFGFLPRILALLDVARRMRDAGGYDTARAAAATAFALCSRISDPIVRGHLSASCHIQQAWTAYRQSDIEEADRRLAEATRTLDENGQVDLQLRAELLTVRSLIGRRRHEFDSATQDLWTALESAVACNDLRSVVRNYQNLAYLIEAIADADAEPRQIPALLEKALACSERNSQLRRRLGFGYNSVVADIHRAHLLRRLGRYEEATAVADAAFEAGRIARNWPDVEEAHFERIRIRFARGMPAGAERLQAEFIKRFCVTKKSRSRAAARFDRVREQGD